MSKWSDSEARGAAAKHGKSAYHVPDLNKPLSIALGRRILDLEAEVASLKATQETDREMLAASERNIAALLLMASGGDLSQPVSGRAVTVRDHIASMRAVVECCLQEADEHGGCGCYICKAVDAYRAQQEGK